MIKIEYVAVTALVLLWLRGSKAQAASTQVADSIPVNGTDWNMGDMWSRLSGAGLTAPGYANLSAGPQADPGKIGQLSAGILPHWDGALK